ncbi:hypothetical protein GLAREA_05990 [Glarea lozoyensis ATCC 20868]|uniref:Uncharacterized protein n=1 Tax=Glarea lozoyensis (strain ATCC 20868 / MF5171) TaxID=1116229 RepID=S3E3G0_GLAL2|nr:uncharacterized protein GLAREA_05990 [Glarea lozoyensis ATCC 20868]EPE32978.1 hypothetical protein GLAREA_05990 [Glarea lozoyensis ATCC 20868]
MPDSFDGQAAGLAVGLPPFPMRNPPRRPRRGSKFIVAIQKGEENRYGTFLVRKYPALRIGQSRALAVLAWCKKKRAIRSLSQL